MRKHTFAMAAGAALLLACGSLFANGSAEPASSASSSASSSKRPSVKIGFIGPLTGDNSSYGILQLQADQLALEEYNADPNHKLDITLVVEDSEGSQEKALASIQKLDTSDKIAVLQGPVFTGPAFTVGDYCEDVKLPMMSGSASHKDITKDKTYVFRTTVSDGLQGEVAGKYFYEVLGYKKLGILYAMNDYSVGLRDGMKAAFQADGGKVTAEETCQVGDKDFRTQLTRLRDADVEAIYIPNYTVEIAQILVQAKELGITKPFLSGDGFSNPQVHELSNNSTHGVVYIASPESKDSPLKTQFEETYTKKYNIAPDAFAHNSYDATNIIIAALERAYEKEGKFNRTTVRNEIAATKDFQGVNGTMNFQPNGDLVAYEGVYKVEGNSRASETYQGTYGVDANGKLVKVE